jgi:putative transposase
VASAASTGGKLVSGRKRHILVDTLGLLLRALVLPADIQDRDAGLDLLVGADHEFPRLELLWVDGAYAGEFEDWVETVLGWRVVVVRKLRQQVGFYVLPVRWRVERTLAWLCRNRRLAKDYERLTRTGEMLLYAAMARLTLRRLAKRAH